MTHDHSSEVARNCQRESTDTGHERSAGGRAWKSRWWVNACVLLLLIFVAQAVFRGGMLLIPSQILEGHVAGRILLPGARLFLVIQTALFVWRMVLFMRYRPHLGVDEAELPRVTVIVPAYNEGRHVFDTLKSLLDSDYPPDKMQIIAVDDGSRDDTWEWIKRAARNACGRIDVIRMGRNRGKREALVAGFHKGRGELFVTVDSDSIVEPRTLRNLVAPFVWDARIGAVAGNVRVLNRAEGLIPKMMDVTFLYGFDFMRAGQSEVNTVTCTPGALSAYRADVTLRILEEWRAQTYCGRPANIGEDRHMTNLILREGYHVTFQQDAVVWTKVPNNYPGLCKMFIRWARSNVRENLVMSTFLFRKFREAPASGARINLLAFWMQMTVSQVLLVVTLGLVCWHPAAFGLQALLGIATTSVVSAVLYFWRIRSMDALFAFLYGYLWFFALSWIDVYSLFTSHRSGWLTRDLPGLKPGLSPTGPMVVITHDRRGNDTEGLMEIAAGGADCALRPVATEALFRSAHAQKSTVPALRAGAL